MTDNINVKIHETAVVDEGVEIGEGTKIWHFSHVMPGAKIGRNCVLGQNVNVASRTKLGDNVKVQNNVSIYDEVYLEDDVFCGPSMVFTNVINPRSHVSRKDEYRKTFVKRGATLGANCTILCGITIGEYAFVGAGAVVTKDVVPYALVTGVPAKHVGWMCSCGIRLTFHDIHTTCSVCGKQYEMVSEKEIQEISTSDQITQVPLLNLKAQYKTIREEVNQAIQEVCENQAFILGSKVQEFEQAVAEYSQAKFAVGVSSGTDAILIALMGLGIHAGDEIITTPHTFFATTGCIARLGAKPVFADIEPDTFNIDPTKIEEKITPKTKAILCVHLFGQCCEMGPIKEIAQKHSLAIVEDAAQSIGAEWNGHRAGSIGDVGCFSFFPSKNLGAFGDGGMVVSNNEELAERIRILRVHGSKPKYYHKIIGGNFRLDALQAAVLSIKLKYLDGWTAKRQQNATDYAHLFEKSGLVGKQVILPTIQQDRHIFNQYTIRVKQRNELMKYLKDNKIGCEIYYPVPMHLQECFAYLGYKEGDFPNTESAAKESLSIPIYPELTQNQKEYIEGKIQEFYCTNA